MSKMTKKQLEAENRWLWFYHFQVHEETDIMFVEQFDTKGNLISRSSTQFPIAKFRPMYDEWADEPKGEVPS